MNQKKVVLGLSGGVDSTACALLLKEQGYEVVCLYFDVLGRGQAGSAEAESIAKALSLPFIYKDISKEFSESILSYFCREYTAGRTPNPCVLCNKTIKYRVLLAAADELNAGHIATGHYARVEQREETGLYQIKVAANKKKDQSYVLWRLGQTELSKVLFPLGDIESKETIRAILREKGFENSEKKDSQEICFVEDGNYIDFLQKKQNIQAKEGNFVDLKGNYLGRHKGIIHYTVGQRKGLGITFGKPVFVTAIDGETDTITLGDNEALFSQTVRGSGYHFAAGLPDEKKELKGKIRYAAPFSSCRIKIVDDTLLTACFEKPQRAPTPGQSIVFYEDDYLLGGAVIEKI